MESSIPADHHSSEEPWHDSLTYMELQASRDRASGLDQHPGALMGCSFGEGLHPVDPYANHDKSASIISFPMTDSSCHLSIMKV